jgi:hypothetical protein
LCFIVLLCALKNVELPPKLEGDEWQAKVKPLRSAYKTLQGVEPEFTNWSKVKEEVSERDLLTTPYHTPPISLHQSLPSFPYYFLTSYHRHSLPSLPMSRYILST